MHDWDDENYSEWRWHYSFLFGIMYGPIPVGLIAAGILLIVCFVGGVFD